MTILLHLNYNKFKNVTSFGRQLLGQLVNHSYRYHVLFPLCLGVFDTTTNQHVKRKIPSMHYVDLHLSHYTCDAAYDHGTIHIHDSITKLINKLKISLKILNKNKLCI